MILTFLAAGVFTLLPADTQDELERCGVDASEMQRLLDMEQDAFDQDLQGGWRPIGQREGCENATAELIKAYMLYSRPQTEQSSILRWHAGQLKAEAGLTDEALALFRASYKDQNPSMGTDWNSYVDATIAFLEQDRPALEAARARLDDQKMSPEMIEAFEKLQEENPNVNIDIGAKPNLKIADRFLACFDEPYAVAYSCEIEAEVSE